MKNCEGCARLARASTGAECLRIHEFPGSILFLGDHQAFEGYCVLMLKAHVRELHELDAHAAAQLAAELAQASAAINAAFKPWKMNIASLGNVLEHMHWHLFPRYEADPDRLQNPWFKMNEFSKHVPSPEQQQALIQKIRQELK